MKDLHAFLKNPFDDAGISMAELLAFTTDHVQKMSNNNVTGDFNTRIAATTTALAGVDTGFSDDETKLGLRKASKEAKNGFRKGLPPVMAQLAAKLVAQYGDKAPQVTECLPHGRTIFTTATDDKLEAELTTFINGVTAHVADLGAPLVASATQVRTDWLAVYAASEGATGVKGGSQQSKNTARADLQHNLFLNLLKIAEIYVGQPAKLNVYMQPSLLEHATAKTPATPTPPTPP